MKIVMKQKNCLDISTSSFVTNFRLLDKIKCFGKASFIYTLLLKILMLNNTIENLHTKKSKTSHLIKIFE